MAYAYPAMVAWDPGSKAVVKNSTFQVYAVGDTSFQTPLAITDNGGNALANLNSSSQGVFPSFQQAQYQTVVVSDVPNHVYAWTVSCSQANPVTPWTAQTYYKSGQPVVDPSGNLVTANINHTSGTSYTASNWTRNSVNKGDLVFNAKDYGAKGDGTTDDYAAINNAATAASNAGGGTVYLPTGTYKISASLPTLAHVRYTGAGIGRTIIQPYQSAAFTGNGTVSAPIIGCEWFDMTWDGSNIPTTTTYKGHFSQYLQAAHWERVECKNFTATGFGSDFLVASQYVNCVATGNGRGQAVGQPGMSGFGIGTGMSAVEDTLITGCTASGNTNYGIFFEKQGADSSAPYMSKGVRIIGNHCFSNNHGIGDCGLDTSVIEGNVCHDNTLDGIAFNAGTGSSPLGRPGQRSNVVGNQCYSNGRDGIGFDYSQNSISASSADHIVDDNHCYSNTRDGLRITSSVWTSDVIRGVNIGPGNKFSFNTGNGFTLATGSGAQTGVHVDDLHLNGFLTSNNHGHGAYAEVNTTRLKIDGVKAYDSQATKTQQYGIYLNTGSVHTSALIIGNDLIGNSTGPLFCDLVNSFSGTGVAQSVVDRNRGYVPGWASITITASPVTYTCGVTPEVVYWAGGSTTDIKITPCGSSQATVILSTGTAAVPVRPGDQLVFDYSTTATSLKTVRQQ